MAIITISRGTFSGGALLAEDLAKRLGYKCLSRELILDSAKEFGVPEYKLMEAIQKGPSAFQRFTHERQRYLALYQATLCEHVASDNVVYHGHAGHFLLKCVPHVLRVRIIAPMEFRINQLMERQKMDRDDAIKHINKVDKQRIKWTKFLYGDDWTSPSLYDMVFNLENLSIPFISEIIQHAVQHDRFKTTPAAKKALDDLLLSSRVRAAIVLNPLCRNSEFTVSANSGIVTVGGKLRSQEETDEIIATASRTSGVTKVINEMVLDYRYQQEVDI
ncbi:cytidylate kinase family protein [Candidatus Poribacteria bacterium]|nr:cytidylate kinase family protein [Candidatus Poribacteria bacterium]